MDHSDFGDVLKKHRLAAGLSQEELADRARLSVKTIGALEQGTRQKPYRDTIAAIADALELRGDARIDFERAGARTLPDDSVPSNLPPQLTSFVNRESVVAEIKELLESQRLVTMVGTGGAGKTRCAIKIAAEMLDGFGDGVWLAELARISDPVLVSTVIARALNVQEVAHRPLLDTLLGYLKRKRLLLILDNCEHVIDEARSVVTAILHGCPNVRILATSRESFTIEGEQAYRIPSLPVPSRSEFLSAAEMSRYGAVQLFSDRAVSADSRFILTVESAPHVAEICRRLDGIPLAIELAAARANTLSPKQLAQKLDHRFRVLTGGDRSALPRHQTMRALIDWSYDLLSDKERALFRKLSIFGGGFTLETAAAVCSQGGAIDEIAVLDLLASLVDKSLVQAEAVGSDTRYRLLESTRQYAREKLSDAGEEDATAQAHARAFLELAEQLYDTWEIAPDRAWYAQAEPELENFRAALSWAFGPRGDLLLGQRSAGVLRRVWNTFSPAEGRRWLQAAQRCVTADTPVAILAALDLAEANALVTEHRQRKASLAAAERALVFYRELADPRGIATATGEVGRAQVFLGNIAQGETLLEHALDAARSLGASRSVIFNLQSLGLARQFAGDLPAARQRLHEALALARALGAERWAALIATNLAETEFRGGDAAAAARLADEALLVLRAIRDTRHVATAGYNMAAYLVALHRFDEARTAARDAVTAACDGQFSAGLAWTLQHLAAIGALRPSGYAPVIEDRRRAARILGYVEARLVALEASRQYTEQQEYDAMITELRDALGEDELSRRMAEGRTWSEDKAIAEAMLI